MNKVYLIAGTINLTKETLYWTLEGILGKDVIGDYAIVENRDSYDLVKIIGIVETTEGNAKKFSKHGYKNMKKVIKILEKSQIEVNKNEEEWNLIYTKGGNKKWE